MQYDVAGIRTELMAAGDLRNQSDRRVASGEETLEVEQHARDVSYFTSGGGVAG